MAIYSDGTRDCPSCLIAGKMSPNRIKAGFFGLCSACEVVAHKDAIAGIAQLEPFLKRRLSFTDWLIRRGRPFSM